MRDKSSIEFEIPVPWAERPVRIHASGIRAVIVAAIVALTLILVIWG